MRVLVTADTIGGVWTYARELVAGLTRRGLEVILVSFGEIPTPEQTQWMDGLPKLDFRPTAFHLEWMHDSEADLEASAEYLQAIIRESHPDLLHLNQFYYGALNSDLPRVVVAHSDVVSWWLSVHGEEPADTRWMRWYRQVVARGLAGASAVAAPSRWMLDTLSQIYGRPERGQVIHNGRTPTLFNPHISKEDYVLSVGRVWDGGKQVTLLAETELPVACYVVGSELHPDHALHSQPLNGNGRVHFKGPQSEGQLRHLYGRAAIYAATSRYEPFGLAPLEAALSRCALVANDLPVFRELWGEAALYFCRNDAGSLREVIQRLTSDRELRLTYGTLAYQRARQRFTADRMVDDYMSLYSALVPQGVMAA